MPTLDSIRFNHDTSSAGGDAINIRRDVTAAGFSTEPEWRRGVSVEPGDSVAAYAGAALRSNRVTIQVTLTRTGNDPSRFFIRARDRDEQAAPEGCAAIFLFFFRGAVESALGNINILGTVPETAIDFGTSSSATLLVEPTGRPAGSEVGVRSGVTRWEWEWRSDAGATWQPLESTSHTIYSLLDIPQGPWTQMPYDASNISLPWARALSHATGWAHLSGDVATAARRVTERANGLEHDLFRYNCGPMPRAPIYCDGAPPNNPYDAFALTQFLDRLERRSEGLGPLLNCSDCASIVTTMANLVGCNLVEGQLMDPRVSDSSRTFAFPLNELWLIGRDDWSDACGVSNFRYHEIAWSGTVGPDGLVYDACAAVDGDRDPRTRPHERLLAEGLRFGNAGELQYRDRLSPPGAPGGVPQPRPEGAGRRTIY